MEKVQIMTNPNPALYGLDAGQVWDSMLAFERLNACGEADTKRTAERRLSALGLLPQEEHPMFAAPLFMPMN